jgi:hypothetical protein
MKWKQTLQRNEEGLIELQTTIEEPGNKPSVISNIITAKDAAERLKKYIWEEVETISIDSSKKKTMVREWSDEPPKPKGFFKSELSKTRPKRK